MTREEIFRAALETIAVMAPGDTSRPTSDETTTLTRELDTLLEELSMEDALWSQDRTKVIAYSASDTTISYPSDYETGAIFSYVDRWTNLGSQVAVTSITAGVCLTANTQGIKVSDYTQFDSGSLNGNVYRITAVTTNVSFTLNDISITDGAVSTCYEVLPATYPVTVITPGEFYSLQDKSQTTKQIQYIFKDGQGSTRIYPIPSSSGHLIVHYRRKIPASIALTIPDIPVAWGGALQYGLAVAICPIYSIGQTKMASLGRIWGRKRQRLVDFDIPEGNVRITIDNGSGIDDDILWARNDG